MDGEETSSEARPTMNTFEDLLEMVGRRGRNNITMFLSSSLSAFVLSLGVYSYVFIGATPNYWCDSTQLTENNWSVEEIKFISVLHETPKIENKTDIEKTGEMLKVSACKMYDIDYSILKNVTYEEALLEIPEMTRYSNQTRSCTKRHFETAAETVVSKWDLVCERRYLYSWTQGAVQLGLFFGSIIIGYIMDRFGRKIVYKICAILFLIINGVTVFASSIEMLIIFRMLSAAFGMGFYLTQYVISMEVCLPKQRTIVGNYFNIPWSLGMMTTALMAYLVRQWYHLQLVLTAPGLLLLLNFWIVPESPRWLILNGYHAEALKELKSFADANGKIIPSDEIIYITMKNIQNSKENSKEITQIPLLQKLKILVNDSLFLILEPKLRYQTLNVFFCWLATATVYYGVSLGAPGITDNKYLYLFYAGMLSLIAHLLLWPTMILMGRRITMTFLLAVTAISIIAAMAFLIAVPKNDYYYLKLILYLIGTFAITSAFQVVYIWTAELYPTEYRSQAIGQSSAVARIGSVASPFINDLLSEVKIWFPAAIFGILSLLATITSMSLSDTSNKNLKEYFNADDNPDAIRPPAKTEKCGNQGS